MFHVKPSSCAIYTLTQDAGATWAVWGRAASDAPATDGVTQAGQTKHWESLRLQVAQYRMPRTILPEMISGARTGHSPAIVRCPQPGAVVETRFGKRQIAKPKHQLAARSNLTRRTGERDLERSPVHVLLALGQRSCPTPVPYAGWSFLDLLLFRCCQLAL